MTREAHLEHELLGVTVDVARGGDVTSIVLADGTEMLWRNGSTAAPSHDDGPVGFFDGYPGGIQELFPNAGPAVEVEGAPLVFHGESCRIPWEVADTDTGSGQELALRTELRRSPFALERVVRLVPGEPCVEIVSRARNLSGVSRLVHWGFHPAFSAALTDGVSRLYLDAGDMRAGTAQFGRNQAYAPGAVLDRLKSEEGSSIRLIPGDSGTADLAFAQVDAGWYVLHNETTQLAVGVTWPVSLMPWMWLWQECRDAAGYPWWGRHHIVAVEPHTAAPVQSLADDIDAGMALEIAVGETIEAMFSLSFERTAGNVSTLIKRMQATRTDEGSGE
jgi:hypothetical protein